MTQKRRPSILSACMSLALIILLTFPMTVLAEGETPAETPVPVESTPTPQSTAEPTAEPTAAPAEPTPVPTEPTPAPQLTVEPTVAPAEPTPVPAEPTVMPTALQPTPEITPTDLPPLLLPTATEAVQAGIQVNEQTVTPVSTDTPPVVKESEQIANTVAALQEAGAVLVDATGNPIPLASKEAAEVLTAPDPTGCPVGVTPTWMGGTGIGCTANYSSIQDALNDPLVIDGAGWTIYIQPGAYNENVQVQKSVKFTGVGTGATATSISLFKDIDNASSWFSSLLVIVNPGASISDGLNLLAPGGTLRTAVKVYQGTTDSHGNLTAVMRDNSNNASPTYQMECGEPNVTINLGSTYNMILMDPLNTTIQNYYTPNAAAELEDLGIAVNVAADQGWSSATAANLYKERQVYWKILDKSDAGHPFDPAFAPLVLDIQNGVYDSVTRRLGIYFVVPTLNNNGVTPSPASAQLTFIKTCDDGNPTTINILNADGTCSYQTKTCNDGYASTNDNLNPNGTCSFSCTNGATNPPTCTTCLSGNVLVNGSCVPIVTGCMVPGSFNYNSAANTPDQCIPIVTGCMDRAATNFNQAANTADNTQCAYPKAPSVLINPLLIPVTGECIPDVITAGIGHTCAVTPQTGLRCWGLNDSGQLGDGKNADSPTPVKVKVLDGGEVVQLASGIKHTCALTTNREVMCWGLNDNGQLGNGTTTNSNIPVKVKGLIGSIESIAAGENFTCATNTANTIMCWGNNSAGQFKNGKTENSSTPVVAGLGTDVKMISGGQNELQGVLTDGALQFWSNMPAIPVTGLTSGVALVSADRFRDGGCAMTSDGKVNCWGGILGTDITTKQDTALLVEGNIKCHRQPLVTGEKHGCTITDKGLSCWGTNGNGQLGDGTQVDSEQPVLVTGIKSFIDLAAGFKHTCAIIGVEEIRCWGQNIYGQLGNGTKKDSSLPVTVLTPTLNNKEPYKNEG